LRVARVGPVILTVYPEFVNLRSQDFPHQARCTGKLDDRAARRNLRDLEALRREPTRDCLKVGIGGAKLLPELFGSEPLVKLGGRLHLLLVEQLPQRNFLIRPALQDQQHAPHGQAIRRHALVVCGTRQRVDVPSQGNETPHVHGLRHASAHGVRLCLSGGREQDQKHG